MSQRKDRAYRITYIALSVILALLGGLTLIIFGWLIGRTGFPGC